MSCRLYRTNLYIFMWNYLDLILESDACHRFAFLIFPIPGKKEKFLKFFQVYAQRDISNHQKTSPMEKIKMELPLCKGKISCSTVTYVVESKRSSETIAVHRMSPNRRDMRYYYTFTSSYLVTQLHDINTVICRHRHHILLVKLCPTASNLVANLMPADVRLIKRNSFILS